MPIYEYKCKRCGHKFCLLQSIAASRNPTKCPNCCTEDTERLVSQFGAGSGEKACRPGSPFT